MKFYHRKEWLEFRSEVIEFHDGKCYNCGRTRQDGIRLQVHHKKYMSGKLPWEYSYEMCEALCRGCHAVEHGKVRPSTGWTCEGYNDIGERDGECELCGAAIRHVFYVEHEKWAGMEVGETCCDHLTETREATDYIKLKGRMDIFVASRRWEFDGKVHRIKQKQINLAIIPEGEKFQIVADDIIGKQFYASVKDAKETAFRLIDSGEMGKFLAKKKPAIQNSKARNKRD